MSDSKAPAVVRKPRPDFPLFPHATGRWAKKVRGKLCYFGKTADDPKGEAALRFWLDQRDDLLAGRTPRAKTEGLTVGELCDRFLQAKDAQLDACEIIQRTRDDYESTAVRIVAQFGKTRLVTDLASDDFESLRASIAKVWGPVALGNEIQRVRVVFKYAYDAGLIGQPMRYGPLFKRPSKKVLRLARAEKGPKMLEAAEVRRLIEGADVHLKAMILLAVNCAFGNNDVGTLPLAAVDLDGGWVNYHRPKTGIDRRCPLWPETIKALRESLAIRPAPKDKEAEKLVFVTRCGTAWAKDNTQNPVAGEFGKLIRELRLHKAGFGFYTLRHVFRTIAGGAKDLEATRAIMGHANEHVEDRYIERIGDDRLQAVAEHVRAWLFAEPMKVKADSKVSAKHKPRQPRKAKRSGRAKATAKAGDAPLVRIVG